MIIYKGYWIPETKEEIMQNKLPTEALNGVNAVHENGYHRIHVPFGETKINDPAFSMETSIELCKQAIDLYEKMPS